MKHSREQGMQTFDQCLFELYEKGDIALKELQVNADARGDLMLRLKLESPRFRKEEMGGEAGSQIAGLSFDGQEAMEAAKKKTAEMTGSFKPMPVGEATGAHKPLAPGGATAPGAATGTNPAQPAAPAAPKQDLKLS